MDFFRNIRNHLAKFRTFGIVSLLLFLNGCDAAMSPFSSTELFKIKKENCWPCTLYREVWEKLGTVTTSAFPRLCEHALTFLGIGLLFWLVFSMIKVIGVLKAPNMKEFIGNTAAVLFKGMVVAIILSNTAFFESLLATLIVPVIQGFTALGRTVMQADATVAKLFATATHYTNIKSSSVFFTAQIGNEIQDLIYRIYIGFHSGMYMGTKMIFTLDFTSQMIGVVLVFMFFYLMLMFPMLFIEGFVLVGAVILMSPFFLVCFVFPSTKGFVSNAWKVIFISMTQLVLSCLFMAVLLNLVSTYSKNGGPFSLSRQITDPLLLLQIKDLQDQGLAFLALSYIMFKMTNEIPSYSAKLFGDFNRSTISKGIQRLANIGKQLGMFAAGLALSATGAGAGVGKAMMARATTQMGKTLDNGFSASGPSNAGTISDAEKGQSRNQK